MPPAQREWLDGPLNALVPDEVEKSFVSAQRAMSKAVKVFAESAGCLGIAKQLRQEMLAFQVNVPVVQARRLGDLLGDISSAAITHGVIPWHHITRRRCAIPACASATGTPSRPSCDSSCARTTSSL